MMNILQAYCIPHTGLSVGIHEYDFEIHADFFQAISTDIVSTGNIKVELELEKINNVHFRVEVSMEGTLQVECARCTSTVDYPIQLFKKIVGKVTDKPFEDDEAIIVSSQDHEIQLAQVFYELIILNLPMKFIPCEEGLVDKNNCNQEILTELRKITPIVEEPIDPRWGALKNFLD